MALKTKFVLKGFKFDKGGMTKAADRAVRAARLEAARAWLKAVIKSVPVWSGQAAGSVKLAKGRSGASSGMFLSQYLKVNIPINAPHPRPNKNVFTGGVQGRYTFSDSRNQYRFTFQTDVIYYVIQDFFNMGVSPSAPWRSMEAGQFAFEETLFEEMVLRLPRLNDYILE